MICIVVSSFVLLESAATLTVKGTTTFDYGTFVSEYVRIESSTVINWYQAVDICRAYGTGWDIAGVYSSAGNSAVMTTFSTTTGLSFQGYIGGYYPSPSFNVAPNMLVWYGGRFRGTRISKGIGTPTCLGTYCNYRSGEPTTSQCTAEDGTILRERSLVMYSDGTWNDLNPEGCPDYSTIAGICERSACSIQVDCVAANTASISGVYSPSCTCTCKAGYRGAKCQVLDTTVTANGISYGAWCDASPMNASVAQSRCAGQGSGWTLASIPTSGVDAMIRGLTTDSMWTGGTYMEGVDKFKWQYGRSGDLYFSSGLNSTEKCAENMYCNWQPSQPDRADCLDGSALEKDVIVRGSEWSSGQQWDDMWANGCGLQSAYNVNCYVCERSACSINIDCVAANTISVAGSYYPSCVCSCKAGYGGAKCEVDTTILTVGNMEYSILCDSSNINVFTAQARCVAKGQYWSLASVMSGAANSAMANAAPNQNIWIGARYNAGLNRHEWMYGRQAGRPFSTGLGPSMSCVSGMYCNWGVGQPDRVDCGDGDGPQAHAVIWGKAGVSSWDDTFTNGCGNPIALTSCYACERSPCLQTDCAKGYTRPRGYYPDCTCSTISATLSLSTTVSTSETISVSLSPSMSATSTSSMSITSSMTNPLSTSLSATPSRSLFITATTSLPTTMTLTLPASLSITATSSISVPSTTSLSQSTSLSDTSTNYKAPPSPSPTSQPALPSQPRPATPTPPP